MFSAWIRWFSRFRIVFMAAGLLPSMLFGQVQVSGNSGSSDSLQIKKLSVVLPGREKAIELPGKMIAPMGDARYPLVLMIGGSSFSDQERVMSENKLFPELAEHLGSAGITSVWWDFPDSGSETTFDMYLDVMQIISFLKRQPNIDSSRVGLIGYGEGGLVAAMVAGELESVSFLVLLATPAIRGDAFLLDKQSSVARSIGVPEETIDKQQKLLGDVHTVLRKNSESVKSSEKIRKLNPAFTQKQISFFNSAWYRTYMVIEPEVYLKLVSCPVLAMNGSLDKECDPKSNQEAIEKAFIFSGNRNYTIEELPELNHRFQIASTGSPEEYGQISESVSPAVLERVKGWIGERW